MTSSTQQLCYDPDDFPPLPMQDQESTTSSPTEAMASTSAIAVPTVDLTQVIASASFRREDAIKALAETQNHINKALALEAARRQMAQAERENSRALSAALRELAASPLIGKDTQAAFLRTVMLDYLENKTQVESGAPAAPTAPALRDVLAAAKLLNDTAGLNAPTKTEVSGNIELKTFPVAQAPFRSELPDLEIKDAREVRVL